MGTQPLSYKRMNSAPRPRRSQDARATGTRARLLAAARDVVASRGTAGATSREITEAAGANLAAITYHFGSKDELVAAALSAEVERLVEPALAALEADDDPATRLAEAVRLLLDAFAGRREDAPAYVEAVLAGMRGGGAARTLVADVRARLAVLVGQLRAAGTVPGWVEPQAMAALVVAVAQGVALGCALDPDGPGPEAQAAQFAGLLLAARP